MLNGATRIEKIAGVLSIIGIVTVPLEWVPMLVVGTIVLEVPNVVSAVFALILPLALLVSRRMWRVNLLFGLLVLWALVYFSAMNLHGTPDGIPIARQLVMQAIFGWTLALSIAHSNISISKIGFWALICLGGLLTISAALVGLNLAGETLNYILTGDRVRFLYRTMRPIFNAFVPGSSDINYVASQVNSLASSIAMFAALVFLQDRGEARSALAPERLVAFGFLGFAFLIFSTSANLVIFVFLTALMFQTMVRAPMITRVGLPILFVAVCIVAYGPFSEFVGGNLMEDTNSRDVRLGQYNSALDMINSSVLWGVGYFEYSGFPVHNWPLFSWSTAGYLAFMLTLAVYLVLVFSGFEALRLLKQSGVVLFPLITLFVVRTLVGGGGGTPFGSAIVAVAIVVGLLERYRRVERQELAAPASGRRHGDAIRWDAGQLART